MIFISCSFDPFSMPYGEFIHSLFQQYGVDAYIAKHPASGSLPEVLKSYVQKSEAMVALVTQQESPWQQTEITWAYDFSRPVYGIVQEGIDVRGILPYITVYKTFSPSYPDTLKEAIEEIVVSISELKKRKQQQQRNLVTAGLVILGLWAITKGE